MDYSCLCQEKIINLSASYIENILNFQSQVLLVFLYHMLFRNLIYISILLFPFVFTITLLISIVILVF